MAGMMRLHHFAHSSASYRVRIALALKGLAVDYVTVDMLAREQQGADYAALNPQRLVPCLELEDGRVIAQSLAIIAYLETLRPAPALWPDDPVEKAQVEAQCLMIAADTSPVQARIVQRYLEEDCGLPDAAIHGWLTHWIRRGLAPVEDFVRKSPHEFAAADTPGMLDLMIVPQLRNAERFGIDVSDFTALAGLAGRCLRLPAFQAAHPDNWS
ncbi:maleylacetoacetate isomerase [Celeribacter indicus]|uniref:Maleylacetoacetate isomerase MaiA n=1 Tax=Celeribacter indicus TaxID=1208324 RepID=A0A0B5DWD6_9RHOB|nr:maleylacetoacetate isomerase [Celeribacter indicus]AJE45046.1 maleylacetoacetate isomerase MaiA [Celeribacter indicus]SDX42044.1 maleylacetoacetate isomerase [Celeribacter indicus]